MPCFFLVELRLVVFLTKTMRLVPRTVKSLRSNDLSLMELQEQIQVLLSLPQRWRRKPTRWDSNGFRLTKIQRIYWKYSGNHSAKYLDPSSTIWAAFWDCFGLLLKLYKQYHMRGCSGTKRGMSYDRTKTSSVQGRKGS